MAIKGQRAIFLDKDGTLIHDVPYNVDPHYISLYNDAGESLSRLHRAGFQLIVVSNQSGVARGLFPATALDSVSEHIQKLLKPYGLQIDDFYYCIHAAQDACACRKPGAGLINQAVREHGIDPAASWMIGDILNDIEAGKMAGCRSILIDNGNETEWVLNDRRMPDYTCRHLAEATDILLTKGGEPAYETINHRYNSRVL